MRPLNAASYIMIEGFEGLAPDGLPGHRRVDHRLRATSEGSGRRNPHRGPSLQGTRTPSGSTSDSFTPIHRNLEKLTIFKLCGV